MTVGIDSDAAYIPAVNFTEQAQDPAAPASGHAIIYVKEGGVYVRRATGAAVAVGGSTTLTEHLLGVGDANGILSDLAAGATGAVPTRQSDGSIAEVVPTAGGGGGRTLISTHVVASGGEASYAFTSIPSTYTHLELDWVARSEKTGSWGTYLKFILNDDTGNNYDWHTAGQVGYGGPSASGLAQPFGWIGMVAGGDATAGAAGAGRLVIPFYKLTTFWHQAIAHYRYHHPSDSSSHGAALVGLNWRATAAITKINIVPATAHDMAEGSVFSLYGSD
jgi:hypothetical protein